jgi:hypothetical protein
LCLCGTDTLVRPNCLSKKVSVGMARLMPRTTYSQQALADQSVRPTQPIPLPFERVQSARYGAAEQPD